MCPTRDIGIGVYLRRRNGRAIKISRWEIKANIFSNYKSFFSFLKIFFARKNKIINSRIAKVYTLRFLFGSSRLCEVCRIQSNVLLWLLQVLPKEEEEEEESNYRANRVLQIIPTEFYTVRFKSNRIPRMYTLLCAPVAFDPSGRQGLLFDLTLIEILVFVSLSKDKRDPSWVSLCFSRERERKRETLSKGSQRDCEWHAAGKTRLVSRRACESSNSGILPEP